jgi:hypothetical protein
MLHVALAYTKLVLMVRLEKRFRLFKQSGQCSFIKITLFRSFFLLTSLNLNRVIYELLKIQLDRPIRVKLSDPILVWNPILKSVATLGHLQLHRINIEQWN